MVPAIDVHFNRLNHSGCPADGKNGSYRLDIGKSNIPTALLQEIGQANAHAAAGCKGPDSFVGVEAVYRNFKGKLIDFCLNRVNHRAFSSDPACYRCCSIA
jgi:hypothetical protein